MFPVKVILFLVLLLAKLHTEFAFDYAYIYMPFTCYLPEYLVSAQTEAKSTTELDFFPPAESKYPSLPEPVRMFTVLNTNTTIFVCEIYKTCSDSAASGGIN